MRFQINKSLMWEYKWRLLVEQCFLCMASLMGLYFTYQLSFWLDLYLGLAIVWYSLRGKASLIPISVGGLVCLLIQNTLSLETLYTVMLEPLMAWGIVTLLLKCTGPFLPLLAWRQTMVFTSLVLLVGVLQQAPYFLLQGVFDWTRLSGQVMGSVLCLSFFSHWDSHVPERNQRSSKKWLPVGYLSILFLLSLITLLFQNTPWFEGCFMAMTGWFLLGQVSMSLLSALGALILMGLTLGLMPTFEKWQFVSAGISWILVAFQLEKNDRQYHKEALAL